MDAVSRAVKIIKQAKHVTAFSGAGISVESGIPPFRGKDGLWSKYDPRFLEIDYFLQHPAESWALIKEIFYDFFTDTEPNTAHFCLAKMEQCGLLKTVITQNVDNLHRRAGSRNVLEFHGTSRSLSCLDCKKKYAVEGVGLSSLPPRCPECDGLLKPDFIFFGEAIPEPANTLSFRESETADVFLVIGTSGEIMPASMLPSLAKQNGARIIEINMSASVYTQTLSDVFLQGKATEMMAAICEGLSITL